MDPRELKALISVVNAGSFHDAARESGFSRSTLRSRIAALELAVGRPLLVRTHRGIIPTELGIRFIARAQKVLCETAALEALTWTRAGDAQGVIHIRVQTGVLLQPVAQLLGVARTRFPELRFNVQELHDPTRDVPPEADLIIYFGRKVFTGPYRTVTLNSFPIQALASAQYLAQRGRPQRGEDLADHTLMSWTRPGEDGSVWPLVAGGALAVDALYSTNNQHSLRLLAAADIGIVLVPNPPLAGLNKSWSELEAVLPDIIGADEQFTVLIPESRRDSPTKEAWLSMVRDLIQAGDDRTAGAAAGEADGSGD